MSRKLGQLAARSIIVLTLSVAILVALAACGLPDHGVVVGKRFKAAQSWQSYDCQTTTYTGSNGQLRTGQSCGWVPHYDPECYLLKVREDGKDGKVGSACIEPLTWEAIQVGDRWGRPRG